MHRKERNQYNANQYTQKLGDTPFSEIMESVLDAISDIFGNNSCDDDSCSVD